MRIEAVELVRVAVPLVEPFRSAHGTEWAREVLLVRVRTGDGDGWGEDVALAAPTYHPEFLDASHLALRDHLVPRVLGREVEEVVGALADVRGWPMARHALATAALDARLRAAGVPLHEHLGGTRTRLAVGVVVGLGPIEDTLRTVARRRADGYTRVKLKIAPGHDLAVVAAVRDLLGPDVDLQVDANGAYRREDAGHLAALDRYDLALLEQPLPADDLEGHAALARRLRTPVCLDESITSWRAAVEALDRGACSVVAVKPALVGGLAEAVRIHDLCRERGVALWCGGMLETGVGRAASLALASLPGFTLPPDLSASDRYVTRDLTTPFVLHDGHLDVPSGPGIGVVPDPEALGALGARHEVLSRSRPGLR